MGIHIIRFKFALMLSILFTFGCSEEKVEQKVPVNKDIPYSTNWLFPQLIGSMNFRTVSFPVWFNKDWILKNGISQITLKKYVHQTDRKKEFDVLNDSIPKQSYAFNFKDGTVTKFVLSDYYDDRLIGESAFDYPNNIDNYGYNLPTFTHTSFNKTSKTVLSSIFETVDASQPYVLIKKNDYDSTYLRYISNNFGVSAETYLTDSAVWSYYTIDKVFEPKKEDLFVYGTPSKPVRSFSIHNLVELPKTSTYLYSDNGVVTKSIYKKTNETLTRAYQYSENGLFTGFTDSTFVDSNLIFVHQTDIQYNSNELPERIIEKQSNTFQPFVIKHIWSIACQ